MAGRRYTRDNRGRFASVGATARGGRLRTEAGNKRATVTGKIEGAVPKGTVAKPRGMAPDKNAAVKIATNQRLRARAAARAQAAAPQPPATQGRQRVRGNFRPQNTMAKPLRDENPFDAKATKAQNVERAQAWLVSKGESNVGTYARGKRKGGGEQHARTVQSIPLYDRNGNVSFNEKPVTSIELNRSSTAWKNPAATSRERRASGWISTSSPVHTLRHEMGHVHDPLMNKRGGGLDPWGVHKNRDQAMRRQRIAGRVSKYAQTQPDEFVAETYAGLRAGHRYDHEVMRMYRQERGTRPRSIRSQIKRK